MTIRYRALFSCVTCTASFLVLGIGLGSLVSVATHHTFWFRWFPSLTHISSDIAVALCCGGCALALLWNPSGLRTRDLLRILFGKVCAFGMALVGLLALGDLFGVWVWSLDDLLQTPIAVLASVPAIGDSVPAPAAVSLLLMGTSLLILDAPTPRGQRLVDWLVGVVAFIAVLGLIGYLYKVPPVFHAALAGKAILPVSGAMLCLAVGTWTARPERGLIAVMTQPAIGGWMLRRVALPLLVLPFVLGWVRLQGERVGLYGTEFGLTLFSLLHVTLVVGIVWWSAWWLNRLDTERQAVATALRASEEKSRARAAALEVANHELESFSFSVSHDLRAPLRAIIGFTDILRETVEAGSTHEALKHAHHIGAAAGRMEILIDDLLAYSRVSREQLPLRSIALASLVPQVIEQMESQIQATHAQIRVEQPLPAVRGHAAMLAQVVTNLVSNAVKFSRNGASPEVRIWGEDDGARVRISIADNGIGIAPEHRERIFQLFERLHGIEHYPGTGIGLAIVKKGVEKMGGSVGCESTPSTGSRFWIILPRG